MNSCSFGWFVSALAGIRVYMGSRISPASRTTRRPTIERRSPTPNRCMADGMSLQEVIRQAIGTMPPAAENLA